MPEAGHDRDLSPVIENYLEVIFRLEMHEGAARASAIAEAAGVSRPTVTSALKSMQSMGLVDYEPYSLIHLTEKGMAIGRDIAHRHYVFKEFFERVLAIEPGKADAVACELEHVVPQDVVRRLGQFVLFLNSRSEFWKDWQDAYAREGIARKAHGRAREVIEKKRDRPENPEEGGIADTYR